MEKMNTALRMRMCKERTAFFGQYDLIIVEWWEKKFQDPYFKSEKKGLPIIGFIALKTTGLNPGFQRKN